MKTKPGSENPYFDSGEYTWPPTPVRNGIDLMTGRQQNDSEVRLQEGDPTILRDPSPQRTNTSGGSQLLE